MDFNPKIKLKYSAKYAESSNYWKYFIGQTKGLKHINVYERKQEQEAEFTKWVNADVTRKEKYGTALSDIADGYNQKKNYNVSMKYLEEAAFQGPEIIYFAYGAYDLYGNLKSPDGKEDVIKSSAAEFKEKAKDFFKDYYQPCDKKLFAEMLKMYFVDVPKDQYPTIFTDVVIKKYNSDFNKFADAVFSKSIFVDSTKFYAFLAKPTLKVLDKDLVFQTMKSMIKAYMNIFGSLRDVDEKIEKDDRLYVAGLREMNANKKYYPNANSTMRMSYGKVWIIIQLMQFTMTMILRLKALWKKKIQQMKNLLFLKN